MLSEMRHRHCVLAAVAAVMLGGCGGQPATPLRPAQEISFLDVDGHSGAYGTGADEEGPRGTGASSQVARALGLRENNNAEVGATLQESGIKTDGWGKVLRSNPRPPRHDEGALPRMALLWYGGNDLAAFGPDLSRAKQAYRVIISRNRASAVYEAGDEADDSIRPDDAWTAVDTAPGEASGESELVARTPGTVIIDIPARELVRGSTVDLGFVQREGTSARYTVEVDGRREGVLSARAPLSPRPRPYVPEHAATGYVFRIEGLSAGRHRISVRADNIRGQAVFDYWQVEPPKPEPVVLVKHYLYPTDKVGAPVPNKQIVALNRMIEAVSKEFGPRVITVDPDPVVNQSRALISRDTIHLNQQGHDLVAEAVIRAIENSGFADEVGARRQ